MDIAFIDQLAFFYRKQVLEIISDVPRNLTAQFSWHTSKLSDFLLVVINKRNPITNPIEVWLRVPKRLGW